MATAIMTSTITKTRRGGERPAGPEPASGRARSWQSAADNHEQTRFWHHGLARGFCHVTRTSSVRAGRLHLTALVVEFEMSKHIPALREALSPV